MPTPDDVAAAMAKVTAALPVGEDRPGQVEMARVVAQSIEDKRHLIVQAGTGTGKSLAYLVPVILMGVKCVVATPTMFWRLSSTAPARLPKGSARRQP